MGLPKNNKIQIGYILNKEQEKAFINFLNDKISSRQLAEITGLSHQQSINAVCRVVKQWILVGKLKWEA